MGRALKMWQYVTAEKGFDDRKKNSTEEADKDGASLRL
jgi:hypothetical protein